MSESVNLPALGESVTEGTVTRWLKSVGDRVEIDEPLVEVSTDKVDTEIPSPIAGVIEEILVAEDETVEVGTPLVRIGDGSSAGSSVDAPAAEPVTEPVIAEPVAAEPVAAAPAPAPIVVPEPAVAPAAVAPPAAFAPPAAAPAPAAAPPAAVPAVAPAPAAVPVAAPAAATQPTHPVPSAAAAAESSAGYITPIVRKLAHEHGVDLNNVTGTGVGGRIRKQDILAAKPAPAAAPKAEGHPELVASPLRGTTVAMSRLRKVIAERAVISMQSTAQLTTVVEIDVTKVAIMRTAVKGDFEKATGTKLSFLPFFAKAATEALRAFPIINASVDGDSIVYPDTENLSIAVDTERGLLTPVIRNAGDLTIADLAREIADLATRTRDNKLKPDELAGGTFTLTNTGSRGALFDTPIVFLPQVAILGTGIVSKKPAVITVDGSDVIAVRSMVYFALSYDHRIVDGADAARFLSAVKARLEAADFASDLGI
jgi:2-oxoglutarate dehydrogenase E2 component (dihydrolipoamide succinyltransferase)